MLACCALLAACSGGVGKGPIPPEQLQGTAYRASDAPSLTLISVINNRTGAGGHTALMVSADQRVIFDPAGNFRPDWALEHGDVLYGITPRVLAGYKSAHARSSHHVVSQRIVVRPDVAARALALVQANGSVPSAFCANATSSLLQQLPGFEGMRTTFYPDVLMEQFATLRGVETDTYYENDAGDLRDGVNALASDDF